MDQSNYDEYIMIRRYLDNEMTRDERAAFEIELNNNKSLKEELTFEANLLHLGNSAGEKINSYFENDNEEYPELLALIAKARKNWEEENKTSTATISDEIVIVNSENNLSSHTRIQKLFSWKRVAIAAAIIGAGISGIIIYLNSKDKNEQVVTNKQQPKTGIIKPSDTSTQKEKPKEENIVKTDEKEHSKNNDLKEHIADEVKSQRLYGENFTPDRSPEDKSGILQEAYAYYDKGDYSDAIDALKNSANARGGGLDKNEKLNDFYKHYYLALSLLADSSVIQSIQEFNIAIDKTTNELSKSKAKWYLALAYLKANEDIKSETFLNELSISGAGEYKAKAKELMRKLK